MFRWLAVTLLGAVLGCSPTENLVYIDVRTDWVGGVEFDEIRLTIGEEAQTSVVDPQVDYVVGARLTELGSLPGDLRISLELLLRGDRLAAKDVIVEVGELAQTVTVMLSRDCAGVVCGAGEACLGGRCVSPRCTLEAPEFCPPPACASNMDCAVASCATPICSAGVCLAVLLPDTCEEGSYCATAGCALVDPHPYDVEFRLPECDERDPQTYFIRDDGDWTHTNDERFRVFCVTPGDYSGAGPIILTRSGTTELPRIIRLLKPRAEGARHAASLVDSEQAFVAGIRFDGASNWIVERLSLLGPQEPADADGISIGRGSDNNIIDGVRIQRIAHSVHIENGANSNVVQHSLIGDQPIVEGFDIACVVMDGALIRDTRFVYNEIFNCIDAISLIGPAGNSYPGTLIAGNQVYLTDALYSDCAGNRDPSGRCSCAEDGITLHAASDEVANPVLVTENIVWGTRRSDVGCGGGGGSAALVSVGSVRNLVLRGNILFDGANGISLGNSEGVEVTNNLFHSIDAPVAALLAWGPGTQVINNRFVALAAAISVRADGTAVSGNTFIDAPGGEVRAMFTVDASSNRYYNSPVLVEGVGDEIEPTAEASGFVEQCLSLRPHTNATTRCLRMATPPD